MTIYYHKHHIIPKHMGGPDNPSNLIKLTVAEHAEAHKVLWERYGKEEDNIAWLALSGQIEKKEAIRLAQVEGGKRSKGRTWTSESKKKLGESRKGNKNPFYAKLHSRQSIQKMQQSHKGKRHTEETKEKMKEIKGGENNPFYGRHHSLETKKILSFSSKKQKRNSKGQYIIMANNGEV